MRLGVNTEMAMRMKSNLILSGFAAMAIMSSGFVSAVNAQEPARIKQHNAWGSYSYTSGGNKVCFVLSAPTKKEPADRDHGDVYFMLAKHSGQSNVVEPQFTVGYAFKEESKVNLTIDGKQFSMFTKGSNAWMENPNEEATVVAAMRAGSNMSVQGMSRRGTVTQYTYSLSGVTASLNDVANCG